MHRMQTTFLEPMDDRLRRQPEREQLATSDDSMLAIHELPDSPIRSLDGFAPIGDKSVQSHGVRPPYCRFLQEIERAVRGDAGRRRPGDQAALG
jgi:hypothetical protein